jgi:hypothetical protein
MNRLKRLARGEGGTGVGEQGVRAAPQRPQHETERVFDLHGHAVLRAAAIDEAQRVDLGEARAPCGCGSHPEEAVRPGFRVRVARLRHARWRSAARPVRGKEAPSPGPDITVGDSTWRGPSLREPPSRRIRARGGLDARQLLGAGLAVVCQLDTVGPRRGGRQPAVMLATLGKLEAVALRRLDGRQHLAVEERERREHEAVPTRGGGRKSDSVPGDSP